MHKRLKSSTVDIDKEVRDVVYASGVLRINRFIVNIVFFNISKINNKKCQ